MKGRTSKKDLLHSLSEIKGACIARLITNGQNLETEEERHLVANPIIRHVASHLQVSEEIF